MGYTATHIQQTVADRSAEPFVLGIGGSPRKNGNSDVLLQHIVKGAEDAGIQSESVQLRDLDFNGCIGCERCRQDKICTGLHDGMSLLYPGIVKSRGLALVCPTHNYNVTTWMKAFIDRLYCFYNFEDTRPRAWSSLLADQGRKAVLAVICEQARKEDMGFALEAMRKPLEALGYEVVDELPVLGIFDRAKVKQRTDVLAMAEQLGASLAEAISE